MKTNKADWTCRCVFGTQCEVCPNNQHVFSFSIESGSSDSPPTMKRPSPTPNKPTELGEGKFYTLSVHKQFTHSCCRSPRIQ